MEAVPVLVVEGAAIMGRGVCGVGAHTDDSD